MNCDRWTDSSSYVEGKVLQLKLKFNVICFSFSFSFSVLVFFLLLLLAFHVRKMRLDFSLFQSSLLSPTLPQGSELRKKNFLS